MNEIIDISILEAIIYLIKDDLIPDRLYIYDTESLISEDQYYTKLDMKRILYN